MKKCLMLILVLLMTITGCIKNENTAEILNNIDSNTGDIVISGKWPTDGLVNTADSSNAKFIHYETVQMDVMFTKDSDERSITFNKNSEAIFSGSLKGLSTGTWEVSVVLSNSDGTIATKTQTLNVVTGTNNVSFLFSQHDYTIGPKNFAELFLRDFIPTKVVGYFRSLGIAYLGVKSIDVGFTDGLDEYNTFLPMLYIPSISSDSSEVATDDSGIAGTVTYTYDSNNQIKQASYLNDTGYRVDTVIDYNDDLSVNLETETSSSTSSGLTIDFKYTGGYLTQLLTSDGYSMNLDYDDGKIVKNIEKIPDDTTDDTTDDIIVYIEEYNYADDTAVDTVYDLEGNTSEVDSRKYIYDGELLMSVEETETASGVEESKNTYSYTYNSNDQLTQIEYVEKSKDTNDINGNYDEYYPIAGEKINFHYSGSRVTRVDLYELEYVYAETSNGIKQYIFENPISYYLVNYRAESTTTITIEMR